MKFLFVIFLFLLFQCQSTPPKKQSQKISPSTQTELEDSDLSLEEGNLETENLNDLEEEINLASEEESDELSLDDVDLNQADLTASKLTDKKSKNKEAVDNSQFSKITNIQYLSSQKALSIDGLKSEDSYEANYDPVKRQLVIEVNNAYLPSSLKRPYVLKDFKNINFKGLNAYQRKNSKKAKFVIQLRNNSQPSYEFKNGSLLVYSSFTKPEFQAKSIKSLPEKESFEKMSPETSVEPMGTQASSQDRPILNAKTYEEFVKINKFYGRPVTLNVTDAEIKDVLNFIGQEGNVNIVTTGEVQGKVSLKVKNTPWDQVFLTVLLTRNLGYVRRGNILFIAPLQNIIRQEEETRRLIEGQRQQAPLMVEIIYVSFVKPSEVKAKINSFLTPNKGRVIDDDKAGVLVVTDVQENIDRIKQMVRILDVSPRQVLIEGRIVESTESFTRGLGINWNVTGSGIDLFQLNSNITPQSQNTAGVATFDLTAGVFDYIGDLSAKLQLGETNRKVKVLSAPKVITINGKKASIDQTSENIFRNSVTNPTGLVTDSFESKEAKLTMQVEPQITHNNSVILNVDVTREFFGAAIEGSTARPKNSRKSQTNVLVKDGQTAVIAGVYQNDTSVGWSQVPVISHIPILGWLFKSRSTDNSKNELLIFLTPHILKDK